MAAERAVRDRTAPTLNQPRIKVDPILWLIPLMLSSIGILMVTSTTSPMSFDMSGTPFTVGIKQLRWLGFGVVSMLATYCVPVRIWYRYCGLLWISSLFFVFATLLPGIGHSVSGARRWLALPGLTVQPSEILILSIVFVAARFAVRNELNPAKCFAQLLILIGFSSFPLLLQPDLGSCILVVLVCMGMYVERFGWKSPLIMGVIGSALLSLMIAFEPYRMRRVRAFLDPWFDPLDTGFQTIQGLIAFANGGAWGSGLGHGFQKLQYLPAAHTDFIYAALGEELGLVGTLGVLFLCLIWAVKCRFLYNRVPQGFETCVVWGITLTIVLPFFINIAGVTNMMPLTGMPLPFISYGGSALVTMWMRVGILLRVQRESSQAAEML